MADVLITRKGGFAGTKNIRISDYNYTGNHRWEADAEHGYKIKFLTSGTFTPLVNAEIDAFLVGGGAGAGANVGANGGETRTFYKIKLKANQSYQIVIGAGGIGTKTAGQVNGGSTEAFGKSVSGGTSGTGSGGGGLWNQGATDGGDGAWTGVQPRGYPGQMRTTKAFDDPSEIAYAGGGGGAGSTTQGVGTINPAGGYYGGGAGCKGGTNQDDGHPGLPNSGGGGGGGRENYRKGGDGGSGIVIIRGRVNA